MCWLFLAILQAWRKNNPQVYYHDLDIENVEVFVDSLYQWDINGPPRSLSSFLQYRYRCKRCGAEHISCFRYGAKLEPSRASTAGCTVAPPKEHSALARVLFPQFR